MLLSLVLGLISLKNILAKSDFDILVAIFRVKSKQSVIILCPDTDICVRQCHHQSNVTSYLIEYTTIKVGQI